MLPMKATSRTRRKGFGCRKYQAGQDDQPGAGEKQVSQLEARRDEAGDQGQRRRSQQRGAGDDADLLRAEADRREVDRQDDDRKAVAKSAQRPRAVQAKNIRRGFHRSRRCEGGAPQDMSHLRDGARQRLAARQLIGRLPMARMSCT